MKVEPKRFTEGLNVGCERKRGVKDDSKVFGLSSLTAKIELQPMDTGKTESIANWMASVCVCGYEM